MIHEDAIGIVGSSRKEVMQDLMDDDPGDSVDDPPARRLPTLKGVRRARLLYAKDALHFRVEDADDGLRFGFPPHRGQNARRKLPVRARDRKDHYLHDVRSRKRWVAGIERPRDLDAHLLEVPSDRLRDSVLLTVQLVVPIGKDEMERGDRSKKSRRECRKHHDHLRERR